MVVIRDNVRVITTWKRNQTHHYRIIIKLIASSCNNMLLHELCVITYRPQSMVPWRSYRLWKTLPRRVRASRAGGNEFLSMVSRGCRWIRTHGTNCYHYTPSHMLLSSEQTTPRHHVISYWEKECICIRQRTGRRSYSIDAWFLVSLKHITTCYIYHLNGNIKMSFWGNLRHWHHREL